jgi:hypothetical protein
MRPAPASPRLDVWIEAIGFWSPGLPDWDAARSAFRGQPPEHGPALRRPAAEWLPPAERRRAPDSVALAVEVASQAVTASGREARDLASVFTSAHGDLAITDAMCRVLVDAPLLVSPTKFHHSVHNAASGYWGIVTGCLEPSTAVSAFDASFAAGLLEAMMQCAADVRPMLLVGYDIAACGALVSTNDSRGLLGLALVLASRPGPRSLAHLEAELIVVARAPLALRSAAAHALAGNAMSDGLPLFEALAIDLPAGAAAAAAHPATRPPEFCIDLPLSGHLALRLRLGAAPAEAPPTAVDDSHVSTERSPAY